MLGIAVVALGGGCGGAAVDGPSGRVPKVPSRSEVLKNGALGPGDVVEVRVYQEEELTGTYRVSSDGTFDFPLVGVVEAAGRSPGELGQLLTERLRAKYIRDPQVSVFVKEYNSKKVFVLGQVQKPGTFKYEDRMTVVQAITLAGGLKDLADKNHIVVTREVEGEERKFVVSIEAIGLGREENLLLQPGDIVFVPETWL